MFKYDLPYAKPGQFTLQINGYPLNVSKKKSYLIEKMKAHRDEICDILNEPYSAEYTIKDFNGNIVYCKIYSENERGNAKGSTHKKDELNYLQKGSFRLITDANGAIKTDEKLLNYLSNIRFCNRFPVIITNDALVSIATYLPQNKSEFIALRGLGERIYQVCGDIFIQAISDYLRENKL